MTLAQYPSYRATKLSYAPRLPSHWDIRPNGRLFGLRKDRGKTDLPILEVSIRSGVTVRDMESGERKQVMSDLALYQGACAGDIAYNTMRMWQGAVGRVPTEGLVSPAYVVVRPQPIANSEFYARLFRTPEYLEEVTRHSHGIVLDRNRLYWDSFKQIPSVVPPSAEQDAIVRFLEEKEREIELYLATKQRMIEVIEEQRTGLLDHCLYVDQSNLDWRSVNLPSTWKLMPFTKCVVESADYRGATPAKTSSGVFLVTARNVRTGWIDYAASTEYVSHEDYPHIMRRGAPALDDILLTTEAPLGNVALVDRTEIALAQRIIRFRMDSSLFRARFALLGMMSSAFQQQLAIRASGSTADGIKASKLHELLLPCPELSEQDRIVGLVDSKAGDMNACVSVLKKEVAAMEGFRTRLIADAVTGQIDVRNFGA